MEDFHNYPGKYLLMVQAHHSWLSEGQTVLTLWQWGQCASAFSQRCWAVRSLQAPAALRALLKLAASVQRAAQPDLALVEGLIAG